MENALPDNATLIRAITDAGEMRAIEDLQQEVWGLNERDIVSFMMLLPTLAVGGLLLGAFDGTTLVAFAYAIPGHEDGQLILHSDMLAVKTAYRDHNLGYRLKLAQRVEALARGVRHITWTFDPLQSRNAHLNFGKLGVTANRYICDFYGPSSSPLHRGGTDRWWVHWDLDSGRVKARLAGNAATEPDAPRLITVAPDGTPQLLVQPDWSVPTLKLEIPRHVTQWQTDNLPLVARWRAVTRDVCTDALAQGYYVTDFCRAPARELRGGTYILRKESFKE